MIQMLERITVVVSMRFQPDNAQWAVVILTLWVRMKHSGPVPKVVRKGGCADWEIQGVV